MADRTTLKTALLAQEYRDLHNPPRSNRRHAIPPWRARLVSAGSPPRQSQARRQTLAKYSRGSNSPRAAAATCHWQFAPPCEDQWSTHRTNLASKLNLASAIEAVPHSVHTNSRHRHPLQAPRELARQCQHCLRRASLASSTRGGLESLTDSRTRGCDPPKISRRQFGKEVPWLMEAN